MKKFNTVKEALEDLRNGRVILVTDDEDRENEGDMICAAEFATTENVNLMASVGKRTDLHAYEHRTLQESCSFPQMVSAIIQTITKQHSQYRWIMLIHYHRYISAGESVDTQARACVSDDCKTDKTSEDRDTCSL